MTKRVLMVVTNHTTITDDHKTGLWLEEFAVPYLVFKEKGYDVKVASIQGGDVPLDPRSINEKDPSWAEAEAVLKNTTRLSKDDAHGFDAIFLPGGHGTMFDFPDNETLQYVLQQFAEDGRIIAAVCHGPSGLVNATYKDGTPIVKGKTITSFTDEEEREVGLDVHMPFLLESTLRLRGANFVRGEKWTDFSVRDGNLITGQNPQSSRSTAEKVVAALEELA
ncbi:ThiJ/PfpI domain protein [Geobacillus thermoleovorans CCB_US3_UF5]|uniref:Type 1 glutamine amidotransferase domain-containing protein n=3 Tax=Geobacillus thermoleovorans group TaxID=1505648 RepID=A0A2Z3NBE1_GEOTH|nr:MULTISPECIES: type 1 glutamine amidotransferase domain-containing protein [Geobacillus]AEV20338.1 ThiJ/PfpI domain protein [Geobacillus thermoleovorans CCB_US3_UF5]AWO75173.1 type 1 glutamine amidotransferase domain-containing protein [Geobacillus thermoleovorans]MED4972953.1 type 1 glutamine amidotransferase domain-containing protein [Geobacillus thermoleovorans]QCK83805.1 type 1 glutamine amidotransferase domain-containing protein [Geobacillus kaustophilus NBRC 102445]QDY74258.1 type 1 gl